MTVWERQLSEEEREGLPAAVLKDHDRYWKDHVQEAELPPEDEGDDYDEWTKAELQAELESRDLNSQGNKADLIKRLRLNDEENVSTQG